MVDSVLPSLPSYIKRLNRLVEFSNSAEAIRQQDLDAGLTNQDRFEDEVSHVFDLLDSIAESLTNTINELIQLPETQITNLKTEAKNFNRLSDPLFNSLEGALLRLKRKDLDYENVWHQAEALVSSFVSFPSINEAVDPRSRWEIDPDLYKVSSILLQPSLRSLIMKADGEDSGSGISSAYFGSIVAKLDREVMEDITSQSSEKLVKSTTKKGSEKLTNVLEALFGFRFIPNNYSGFVADVIRNQHNYFSYSPVDNALIAYALLDKKQAYDPHLVDFFTEAIFNRDDSSMSVRSILALTNQELPQQAFEDNKQLFPRLMEFLGEEQPCDVKLSGNKERIFRQGLRQHVAKILADAELNSDQFSQIVQALDEDVSREAAEMILSRFLRRTLEAGDETYVKQLASNLISDTELTADKCFSVCRILDSLEELYEFDFDTCFNYLRFRDDEEKEKAQESISQASLKDLVYDGGQLLPMFQDCVEGCDLDMKLDSVKNAIKALEIISSSNKVDQSFPPLRTIRHYLVANGSKALDKIFNFIADDDKPVLAQQLMFKVISAIFSSDQEYLMNNLNLNLSPEDLVEDLSFNKQRFLSAEINEEQVQSFTKDLLDLYDKSSDPEIQAIVETLLVNKAPMILPILVNYSSGENGSKLARKILREV